MNVTEVMTTAVVTVRPEATWEQVAERMLEAGVSGVPVLDADGYLLGIVTEADLVSKPAFGDRRHGSLTVLMGLLAGEARWTGKASGLIASDLMTTAVITAAPDEHIQTVAQRMLDHQVKRLPVLDGGRLVGIVSRRDLLRGVVSTVRDAVQPAR